jgi:hypothetical protein
MKTKTPADPYRQVREIHVALHHERLRRILDQRRRDGSTRDRKAVQLVVNVVRPDKQRDTSAKREKHFTSRTRVRLADIFVIRKDL